MCNTNNGTTRSPKRESNPNLIIEPKLQKKGNTLYGHGEQPLKDGQERLFDNKNN